MVNPTVNTEKKQRNLNPFKKGQSGNPKGRPKGARSKFAEQFVNDFLEAWEANGKVVLSVMATTKPAEFVKVAAQILPKDIKLEHDLTEGLEEAINRVRNATKPKD